MSPAEADGVARLMVAVGNDERAAWLEARRSCIGGSDAPAVLGRSPYGTPTTVFASKLGLLPPTEVTEPMDWGNRLEAAIGRAYADRTGREVTSPGRYVITRHPTLAFMGCTLDFVAHDRERGTGVVQVKNLGWSDWKLGDEAPEHIQIQLQHEIACAGLRWGSICALVSGQRLAWVDLERHDAFLERVLIPAEAYLWSRIERRDPPPVDGTEATSRALKSIYKEEDGETVDIPPDMVARWHAAKAALRAATEEEIEAENDLRREIGSATFARYGEREWLQLKKVDNKGYTPKPVAPFSYRALRSYKPKKASWLR